MPDFTQFKVPTARSFMPQNVDTNTPPTTARASRPVGPDEYVDAQGLCAKLLQAAPPPPSDTAQTAGSGEAGATPRPVPAMPQPTLAPVALDMSECDVVRALGPPQSINIGANERGDRRVTMVYMVPERSGTYEFTSGRLTSLERGPEPPPAPKVEKKPPKKKKKATVTAQPKQPPG
jgi:hypothetical protein